MRAVKKRYRKYVPFLLLVTMLSACSNKKSEITANPPDTVVVEADSEGEETPKENGDTPLTEPSNGESSTDLVKGDEDGSGQMSGTSENEQQAQPTEIPQQEGNRVIRDLSSEEWEQMEQDDTLIMFHSGDGGYYYVDPIEETIYCREIYAHERAEGSESSYFRPAYSSACDETLFAPSGTDESGKRLYDVYYGKELLISGLTIIEGANEYLLDVCYDADAQKVLVLTYHKDSDKKQEGFMIYCASESDTCVQPLGFYPILTGEDYQEFVYHDWIWSAILTPKAIYYDILPVRRIDLETGDNTEWGLTQEEYTEETGIDNPMRFQDTKVIGDEYIMTIVVNPDPAFDDMPENTVDTYLIYNEDGELLYMIPNVH